jgi:predicted outer membrane repeat protein
MRHSLYFGQGRALGAGVLVGLIGLLHSPAQAASYGVNLIVNGNAESGGSSSTGAPVAVPGWTPSSAFTVVPYNAPGGFPVLGGPGPSDAGIQFFAGGNAAVSTATQPIDLAANAADINAGLVTFDLTGWFGGYLTDDDNAVLIVEFYNGSTKLLTTVIGGFKAVDRNNKTGLFFGGLTGFPVPVNTTRLVLTLTMTRLNSSGNFNDGYADSLSLVLRAPAVVTSTADSGAGSLRAAITAGNTITFDPNVFAAASGPHVIILLSALPDLNSHMTITGPGAGAATVQRSSASGTPDFRIFNVANGLPVDPTVIISGITISNGLLEGPNFGPGILNLGTLTLNGSVVTGCHSNGSGGAILNGGTLTLNNSSVSDNQTLDRGGGISNGTSSTLTLNNSSVSRNQSGIDGGGIFNTGTVILNGSTVSGNLAHGGGGIYSAGTLVLSNSTIADNTASVRDGGGIYKQDGVATIDKCTISGNSASASGGGLINAGAASATLTNCTLSSNTAHDGGGGIENRSSVGQTGLTVRNCTLSGNSAGTNGGGLENSNAYFNASNCTFSGNSAGTGGAIYSSQQTAFGGGSIDNTIFKTGVSGGNINDTSNLVVSKGYNLSNDAGGGVLNQTGDRINTDPMIGPLQNNGGPTFTHALLPGSLAIDKGKSTFTIDQRAAPRPVDDPNSANGSGNASDIGAFEVQLPSLANISTRLRVETGDNVLFAGFIVTGTQPKKIIVRAIGTSLPFADKLADPTLELHDASGALLESNDNWMDSPNKQAIIDSTIPPSNPLESAIVRSVPPGNYTAIERGVNNGTGIGVVEAYDLDTSSNSKLANISTRGLVQTGDNVLIAGTIVVGPAAQKVIIRALGPSVPVPGKMADPTLELRDGNGALLEANDNWVDSPNKQAIIDSTIPPPNNVESAIVRTLTPANYTAIVRGANNTTGIAVVEVYALP